MAVDEQALALIVRLLCMACQMNFADMLDWKIREIVERGPTEIRGRHEHVVDVEQQTAPGMARQFAKKVRLAHSGLAKHEIARRVLEQNPPTDGVLHLLHVSADTEESGLGIRQRQ